MDIRVKYEDVNVACKNIKKYADEIETYLEELKSIGSEIYGVWQGAESNSVVGRAMSAASYAQALPINYRAFVTRVSNVNEKFEEYDAHYASAISQDLRSDTFVQGGPGA